MVNDGTDSWTLDALVQRVTAELAERGLLVAQRDGRVAAAPDARTVRYYQSLGLIDRPRPVGREARYLERHRLQLLAIKALQSARAPLAEVQARLYGRSNAELAAVVREAGQAVQGAAASRAAAPASAVGVAELLPTLAAAAPAVAAALPVAAPAPAPAPAVAPSRAEAAEAPRLQHQVEVVVAPGVRLVIEAGAEPPADPASLEAAIGAAFAAWQQYVAQGSRPAGEGGS